jgi:hypothetical protein
MADLQDVVGAILRGVTEARAQADEAARDLAVSYANDPILRSFTVPRAEIRNLTIDLKVAVRSLDDAAEDRAKKGTRIRSIITSAFVNLPFTWTVPDEILARGPTDADDLRRILERHLNERMTAEAETRAREVAAEIYRDMIVVTERSGGTIRIVPLAADVTVPSKSYTDMAEAKRAVDQISKHKAGQPLSPALQKAATQKISEERAAAKQRFTNEASARLTQIMADVTPRVRDVMATPTEKRVDVDVTAAALKDVPPHMISTVSMTLDVVGVLPPSETEA